MSGILTQGRGRIRIITFTALTLPACNPAVQVDETNQLARDLEARYHQPARVVLTADSEMNVYLTPSATVDATFSQQDCNDYAQRVARYAINHYARPASIEYIYVHVVLRQPGNTQETFECEGNGNHGALPPDNETPSILTGAGKQRQ